MGGQERTEQNGHPEVTKGIITENLWVVETFGNLVSPDLGPIVPRRDHYCNCNDQAFSWPIEIAEVQGMCMVCLPGRKEHWQTRDKSSICPKFGGTQAHCSCFAQAC